MASTSAPGGSGKGSGSNQGGNGGGSESAEEVCAFCLDTIHECDACFSTKCPHVSHKVCLLRWLENNRSCATCRTPVVAVKMKSGKNVSLPPLRPVPNEDDEFQPLTEEQMIAGVDLTSEEEDEPYSDENEEIVATRPRPAAMRGPTLGRTTRSRGPPLRPTASETAREAMISRMVGFVAASVGSTRGRLLATRGVIRATGARSAPALRLPDDALDDLEARLAERAQRSRAESAEARRSAAMSRVITGQSRRRRRVIASDDEESGNEELPDGSRSALESSGKEDGDGSESGSDDSETESEESGEDSEEESGSGGSESSELDESVLDDQPSTSRQMIPIVRKKRGAAKKKTTKRKKTTPKKKTEGGTVKRKTKKRKTTKRKGTKRGTKRSRKEEAADQRQSIRNYFPSLSLNGAGMDPLIVDEDDAPPEPKRPRVEAPPPAPAVDPTDLLGSILSSQVVALTHGRHLEQKDGKLVPRESFNKHLDKLEKRGTLPVDRAEVIPSSSSSSRPSSSGQATRPASIATTRTGDSTDSSSSSVAASSRPRLPTEPRRREHGASGVSSRPSTSAVSSVREVPLISPFTRPTPLPPPPTPHRPSTNRPPPPPSSSRSRLPSGFSREPTHTSAQLTAEDKRNAEKLVNESLQRERTRQIREAADSILASEIREGRITDEDRRALMKAIFRRFYDRLMFERDRVVEWTRIELGKVLEDKILSSRNETGIVHESIPN